MEPDSVSPIRLALFGAAPDTANMGVSALYSSAVAGLAARLPGLELVVFDNGLGRRHRVEMHAGRAVPVIRFGARGGRRLHRPENLLNMSVCARLGGAGARLNEAIALIDLCDAVLDVSGGDSFSDIYGRRRFTAIHRPKLIARLRRRPLILLPQTYGPYRHPAVRSAAREDVRAARMAWTRDEDSYDGLRHLLGADFDPDRHRSGVDMAFGLARTEAWERLTPTLRRWLEEPEPGRPLVGLNVSGLLFNSPDGGRGAFGLLGDYRELVAALAEGILSRSTARMVLIPHVMDRPGHYESDRAACEALVRRLAPRYPGRIEIGPTELDETGVKWLISRLDWFCGTRMHSTIAALSSGVPAAAVSYSDKTRGVFASCGQERAVFDPRRLDGAALREGVLAAYEAREEGRESLARALPRVLRTLERQFDEIAACVMGWPEPAGHTLGESHGQAVSVD